MKLRTGKPIWLSYPARPLREKKLSSSMACDVAIIGAGITGALVAHRLLLAGLRVIMIDKRRAGLGSTAASTGLLLIQPDTSIADLTRIHSRRTAQRVYQLGQQAIRDLGILVRRLKIDCGWKTRRTLYVASSPDDAVLLRKEAARTEKIGFPTEQLYAHRIRQRYQIDFPAALLCGRRGRGECVSADVWRVELRTTEPRLPSVPTHPRDVAVRGQRENDAAD